MIRIIMQGCNGRMGNVIEGLLTNDTEAGIVAGIDIDTGVNKPYPVFKSLKECNIEADVLIDFSSPKALTGMLEAAIDRKLPLILCSTGYSEEELCSIEEASNQIAILKSANMSLGINTIIRMLKNIASGMAKAGYDIEIVEKHHNQKLDAPSGTALLLADVINESLEQPYNYVYDRSGRREKRPKNEIGISAVRGGSIVGDHEIIFAGTDEVIEIKHTAYSRAIFAKGAIQAAKYMTGKTKGMYSMQDVVE